MVLGIYTPYPFKGLCGFFVLVTVMDGVTHTNQKYVFINMMESLFYVSFNLDF